MCGCRLCLGSFWKTSACGSGFHFACRTYNPVGQEFHSKIEIRGAGLSPPIASQLLLPSSIQNIILSPLEDSLAFVKLEDE